LGSLGTQFARGSKDAAGGPRRKSAATQGGLIRPKKHLKIVKKIELRKFALKNMVFLGRKKTEQTKTVIVWAGVKKWGASKMTRFKN
jgi:hypothetical protein